MTTLASKTIFLSRITSANARSKPADQLAANNCSGLVPLRAEPGVDSMMSKLPSELRETPFSRPTLVWVLAVYRVFPICVMVSSECFLLFLSPPVLHRLAQRFERRPHLGAEQLGLLPGVTVAALVELVKVDQLRIRTLCPA